LQAAQALQALLKVGEQRLLLNLGAPTEFSFRAPSLLLSGEKKCRERKRQAADRDEPDRQRTTRRGSGSLRRRIHWRTCYEVHAQTAIGLSERLLERANGPANRSYYSFAMA
jgi:hypothetical protein